MEKIKNNKLFFKIICIILAFILWFFVSYQENPAITATVKNVPLAVNGEQALKENGFSVYSVSKKSVNVRATGKRFALARATNRTISASVNVSSIDRSGTYLLPAVVNVSESLNISCSVKESEIKVIIEPIVSKVFSVETVLNDTDNSKFIIGSCTLSENKVSVSAPESVMRDISQIKTEPINPKNTRKTSIKDIRLVAYGKNGKPIDGAECTPSVVTAELDFVNTATVPVMLQTTSGTMTKLPSDYDIEICGNEELIKGTTEIKTEPLDLSGYEKNDTVRVKLILPAGITTTDDTDEITLHIESKFLN